MKARKRVRNKRNERKKRYATYAAGSERRNNQNARITAVVYVFILSSLLLLLSCSLRYHIVR